MWLSMETKVGLIKGKSEGKKGKKNCAECFLFQRFNEQMLTTLVCGGACCGGRSRSCQCYTFPVYVCVFHTCWSHLRPLSKTVPAWMEVYMFLFQPNVKEKEEKRKVNKPKFDQKPLKKDCVTFESEKIDVMCTICQPSHALHCIYVQYTYSHRGMLSVHICSARNLHDCTVLPYRLE